ncbi:hypothetical protein F0562_015960 [Nyssa sinensis]|uniref:Uncharacterized protein n=1 Tax=Nyssa sinensis TaxID=561372 RepID=A0A5J4ZLG3_9ASTE|nr:hypothetical protein F0562_015960 [Nyssa sinensis]
MDTISLHLLQWELGGFICLSSLFVQQTLNFAFHLLKRAQVFPKSSYMSQSGKKLSKKRLSHFKRRTFRNSMSSCGVFQNNCYSAGAKIRL